MQPTIPLGVGLILLLSFWAVTPVAVGQGVPHATVKVWDTAVPVPPSLSLGLTPGESVEDSAGLTGHGTSFPTIVTAYARGSHPLGLSGVSYWNPDGNVFVWYGKTMATAGADNGFPSGVDIHRGGGPDLAGGPFGTSFGPGDVWIGGREMEPLYVHMAGTDKFRTYGTNGPLAPPSGRVWGVEVDEATGDVFVTQPVEARISRLHPPDGQVTIWDTWGACNGSCGAPVTVTVDSTGRPYATMVYSDAIVRVNAGADGTLGSADDTISGWRVPSFDGTSSFRTPPTSLTDSEENPNGITVDASGNVWFAETNSNEVGRLSGGPDGVVGTADDEICEYTTAGLRNPQQIATTGSGSMLQVYITEGNGNSVTVLTQAEADLASFPTRVCTTVAPLTFLLPPRLVQTRMFDEEVPPLRTAIVPTVYDLPAATGGPILRFSPMPNPLLSADGLPIGDAGNGFPSGMTGVYASNRIAGAYLKGNKHFEVWSGVVVAPPPAPAGELPGRMTGGGRISTADGTRVTYGFVLLCTAGEKGKDVLHVNWADGNKFHLDRIDAASCNDDPTIINAPGAGFDTHGGRGSGRFNGIAGASAEWTFTDTGESGAADTARLVIRDSSGTIVLDASGQLQKGKHRARNR